MRGFFMCFSRLGDAGSGQVEKRRSPRASEGAAAARPQNTAVCRLRGEPRQCGDRAHRLIPPSLAPTGERRPSMACLRPIPAPPRLSPAEVPWLRRRRLRQHEGNTRRSEERHGREGRRCKGISSERYMDVPRPRVGAGRETTRRTKSPCSGGPRPKRSFCLAAAAPTRKALQQPKRFSTAGWLVMAAHPGLRRAVRQLQSPSAAATNGGATSTPVCRWAV